MKCKSINKRNANRCDAPTWKRIVNLVESSNSLIHNLTHYNILGIRHKYSGSKMAKTYCMQLFDIIIFLLKSQLSVFIIVVNSFNIWVCYSLNYSFKCYTKFQISFLQFFFWLSNIKCHLIYLFKVFTIFTRWCTSAKVVIKSRPTWYPEYHSLRHYWLICQ